MAMAFLESAADIGAGLLLPCVLFLAGVYFTRYLGGFYLRHPLLTARRMLGGGRSRAGAFRALSVSLAGTLGVGNIVGVGVAIALGGAGALFWMWLSALFSMIVKYAEIVLAMRYKVYERGRFLGGPMYYMRDGVGGALGRVMACGFAALGVLSALTMGNMVQMNAAATALSSAMGVPRAILGVLGALLCVLLLTRGFEGISRVTAVVIPVISLAYVLLSLRVLVCEAARLPAVFAEILRGAFDVRAASGGTLGFFLTGAFRQGVAKGAFSHEAGCGTAAMAHAGAERVRPAEQGTLGIFEVFFDTVVLCTLTGLVILLACDGAPVTENGMHLVIYSFSRYYGRRAAYLISVGIVLFALATVVCWGYYGKLCLQYLVHSPIAPAVYDLIYSAAVIPAAVMTESAVWSLSDLMTAWMTVLNLSALLMLRRAVRAETVSAGLCLPR